LAALLNLQPPMTMMVNLFSRDLPSMEYWSLTLQEMNVKEEARIGKSTQQLKQFTIWKTIHHLRMTLNLEIDFKNTMILKVILKEWWRIITTLNTKRDLLSNGGKALAYSKKIFLKQLMWYWKSRLIRKLKKKKSCKKFNLNYQKYFHLSKHSWIWKSNK